MKRKRISDQQSVKSGIILLLILWAGLLTASMPAAAQSSSWVIGQVASAPDGTSRLLWVKAGTTSASGVYGGDTVSVWTMNASGNVTATGQAYGPYPGWSVEFLASAPDGTSRLLWINRSSNSTTGDLASLWRLDASGNATDSGPAYGPYAGWSTYELSVAPDGTSRLLWKKQGSFNDNNQTSGDQVSVWKMDAKGSNITSGAVYGPYTGWSAYNLTAASDGTSRILWYKNGIYDTNNVYSGDTISAWKLDANGNETDAGTVYGPYSGWSATQLAVATDGTSRLLWGKAGTSNPDGTTTGDMVTVWKLDAKGNNSASGTVYGPYSGWTVNAIGLALDNTARMLWIKPGTTNANGVYSGDMTTVWSLDATGNNISSGTVYGPYAGWSVYDFKAVPDGTSRLLWVKPGTPDANGVTGGDATSLWSLNAAGNVSAAGSLYGPYH